MAGAGYMLSGRKRFFFRKKGKVTEKLQSRPKDDQQARQIAGRKKSLDVHQIMGYCQVNKAQCKNDWCSSISRVWLGKYHKEKVMFSNRRNRDRNWNTKISIQIQKVTGKLRNKLNK